MITPEFVREDIHRSHVLVVNGLDLASSVVEFCVDCAVFTLHQHWEDLLVSDKVKLVSEVSRVS